jgi:putative membrane protein
MRLFIRLLVNAIALWAAVFIVPGLTYDGSGVSLLIIALIFGVVNALVRPIIVLLTCPLVILTLGLFILIINTIMFSLTIWLSSVFGLGLDSTGFWSTFFGALVISVVSGVMSAVLKDANEDRRK